MDLDPENYVVECSCHIGHHFPWEVCKNATPELAKARARYLADRQRIRAAIRLGEPNWWQERRDPVGAALCRARQGSTCNIADADIAGETDVRYVVHADPPTGWGGSTSGLRVWGLDDDRQWFIRAGLAPKAGHWWRYKTAAKQAGGF